MPVSFILSLLMGKRPDSAALVRRATRVLDRHGARWMAVEGVVACAVGLKDERDPSSVVIKIYVRQLGLRSLRALPRKADGVAVVLEETDEIRALEKK